MTGSEHYRAAEKLVDFAGEGRPDDSGVLAAAALAQVHATLALARSVDEAASKLERSIDNLTVYLTNGLERLEKP